uniref:Uncharacterized protein n=1 Tax=Arundo donax TaxID=35708 RepID=A0A0A9F4L4_ARUDO
MSASHCAATPQLSERKRSACSSCASTARYPGRSSDTAAHARSGGSSPCTASNTLRTAEAGTTARSMLGPAAASASRGARIGRTAASMTGSRAWISSSLEASRASAWLSARDLSTPARSDRRAASRLAIRRSSSSWSIPIRTSPTPTSQTHTPFQVPTPNTRRSQNPQAPHQSRTGIHHEAAAVGVGET